MLAERKRYNYNVGGTSSATASRSQQKLAVQNALTTPVLHVSRDENPAKGAKRVEELEATNKKLIEETTRNFKRLESDVQRVERILEEKESHITELQQETHTLSHSLAKANHEKQLLIEALFSKDLIIREFQAKIDELIHQKNREAEKKLSEVDVQTDQAAEIFPADEMYELMEKNGKLLNDLEASRQQLLEASSKVKALSQQFDAYKHQAQAGALF